MKSTVRSPEEYYATLTDDRREQLQRVRRMVKRTWPLVKEDMSNGMPTFHLEGRPFLAIASQKNFMALYVMPYDLLDAFNKDLKAYDHGRSCIRFRSLNEENLELFDRIIRYTGSCFMNSRFFEELNGNGKVKAPNKVKVK